MNNYLCRFLAVMGLVALAAISCPLAAQQSDQHASTGVAVRIANGQGVERANMVAYSADQVSASTQTLADGTTITHKSLTKVYRDSQGRTRHENFRTHAESGEPEDQPFAISINDPVAGVLYSLNPRDHTALRNKFPKPESSTGPRTSVASAYPAPARPALPRPTREDLGTQVIEGLEAKGERITRTIPEGFEGNDRPIQITQEIWRAAETPSLVLVMTRNDPRRGETVMHLTNLVLEEPPAELFQVPSDYTVKELEPVSKPEPSSE